MYTVLIAEDDPQVASLLATALKKIGLPINVLTAPDGEKAISLLSKTDCALLVTDLKMPNVDGLGLLTHVRQHYPELPCIVISGFITSEQELSLLIRAFQPDLRRMLADHTFYFFKKPISIHEFRHVVKNTLETERSRGSLFGISLSSFIQMVGMEEKSCLVDVISPDNRQGTLSFVKGELYDAKYEEIEGEDAALTILAFDNPRIIYRNMPATQTPMERKVRTGAMGLLLEASKRKDDGW